MELSRDDLRRSLAALERVREATSFGQFVLVALCQLYRLVPCDCASYCEVDATGAVVISTTHPPDATPRNDPRELLATIRGSARLARAGVNLLVAALAPAVRAIFSFERADPFSDRDEAVLATLRPHLAAAVEAFAARETLATLERAMEAGGEAVVVFQRGWNVTPAAAALLARYFDESAATGNLPSLLDDYARSGGSPLVIARHGGRLIVQRVPGEQPALVLREEPTALSLRSLASLALTEREREVLAILAGGATDEQIAAALDITPRTVRKHVGSILAKLGVSTRTAAAARAFGHSAGEEA